MGDLLPPEAAARRALSLRVLRTFELRGYELVMPPVFEHADVVQRGNDALESRDLLRFVEPESGEVAVLRPDITPQIARIVATRLTDHPPPFRLCYEGRVFRRLRGRARSHRQISQAGVECVGLPASEGDVEVLSLAIAACEDVGLSDFRIELSDIRLVRSLIEALPEAARAPVSELLAQKDVSSLRAIANNRGVSRALLAQLETLLAHYGDRDVLDSAAKHFRSPDAQAAVRSLREITDRLTELGVGRAHLLRPERDARPQLLHRHAFQHLGVRSGRSARRRRSLRQPAAPLRIRRAGDRIRDRSRQLQSTLGGAGAAASADVRVVLSGDRAALQAAAVELRAADVVCATFPERDAKRCLAFARTWGYDAVLTAAAGAFELLRVADGSSHSLKEVDPGLVRRLARGLERPGVPRRRSAPALRDKGRKPRG